MQFFSQGAFRNPMVVRVAGLAYQEGFGGHFHNDNSVAVLRDMPGPGGRGAGAAGRRRADAADLPGRGRGGRQRLRLPGADRALPHPRPVRRGRQRVAGRLRRRRRTGPRDHVPIGRARVYGSARPSDLTIITSVTGCGCRCGRRPGWPSEGVGSRVVDLRWLAPLPVADIIREAVGDRPGAGRGRDPALRRGGRGRDRRAGRRRLRRSGAAGGRGRLVRTVRPGGAVTCWSPRKPIDPGCPLRCWH